MAALKIESASFEKGVLMLRTPDTLEGFRFVATFKPDSYEIKKAKKRRSVDANGYAWVLIDKLSAALRLSKEDIYRNAIRDIGGVSEVVCVQDEAVESLCDKWSKNGIGWQTEAFPSRIEGCTNVTLYYGSSTYDSSQMGRLIDHLVQDCHALGIETRPEDEVKALLEGWNG